MVYSGVLETTQFAYLLIEMVKVPVMHFFVRVPYTEKCIECGQVARIVQIYFKG